MITEAKEEKSYPDPRAQFMDIKTRKKLISELYNPAYYWDRDFTPDISGFPAGDGSFGDYIDHAAKLKLAGVELPHLIPFERYEYSLAGALITYGANGKDLTKPQRFHRELIRDAANAITLGIPVDLDSGTLEILNNTANNSIKWAGHSEIIRIANCEGEYWQKTLAYSRILGLELDLPSYYKEKLEEDLFSWQSLKIETFEENEYRQSGLPKYLEYRLKFGGLAASIAQARVFGLEIPIREDFSATIEKSLKLMKPHALYYYSHAVADYAVMSARKVEAGPTKGIDLFY